MNKYPKGLLFDECDRALVERHNWHMSAGYVATNIGTGKKRTTGKLHRLIMQAKPGQVVDHINQNPLDNRRANLRICTNQQNCWNTQGKRTRKASGHKGVRMRCKKWEARVTKDYRTYYLGVFLTEKEAVAAVCEACNRLHGDFSPFR